MQHRQSNKMKTHTILFKGSNANNDLYDIHLTIIYMLKYIYFSTRISKFHGLDKENQMLECYKDVIKVCGEDGNSACIFVIFLLSSANKFRKLSRCQ